MMVDIFASMKLSITNSFFFSPFLPHLQGKTVYRVRWKGYGPDDDTWEPRDNLLTCEDMVEAFIEQQKQLKEKKRKATTAGVSTIDCLGRDP